MPERPKRPCGKPGCPELSATGWCDAHTRETAKHRFDKNRPSAWKRGYDAAWQRVRKAALLRDMFLCQECKHHGQIVAARDVDHIIPFDGPSDPLRLDMNNLQSLCPSCHSRKTATEDSGFARKKETA